MDRAWGTIIDVLDGDTVRVAVDSVSRRNRYGYGSVERVRLRSISAPESGRCGGARARRRLDGRLLGHRVRLDIHARDVFGRVVADLDPRT